MITLATVSPCYNEEDVLERSVARLTELFNRLMAEGTISKDSVMVFVNDGSTDATWQQIVRLQAVNPLVRGINLARNVGHQNAIMAGVGMLMFLKNWLYLRSKNFSFANEDGEGSE